MTGKNGHSCILSSSLLRDVINKLNGIHFTASDELHTLGALYESMLREMRDEAGDSGEFYTPRAVVRFMVTVTNPRLGETVLDPASGTGGFLGEAFNHLSQQVKTVAHRKVLQEKSLFGCAPKTLPYLLCQMNLLLHGLDAPQIDPGNALRHKPPTSANATAWTSSSPTRRSAAGKSAASRVISPKTKNGRNRAAFPATHHAKAAAFAERCSAMKPALHPRAAPLIYLSIIILNDCEARLAPVNGCMLFRR